MSTIMFPPVRSSGLYVQRSARMFESPHISSPTSNYLLITSRIGNRTIYLYGLPVLKCQQHNQLQEAAVENKRLCQLRMTAVNLFTNRPLKAQLLH